jgi:hypothetical protein
LVMLGSRCFENTQTKMYLFIYLFREEGGEHGPVKKRETKLMWTRLGKTWEVMNCLDRREDPMKIERKGVSWWRLFLTLYPSSSHELFFFPLSLSISLVICWIPINNFELLVIWMQILCCELDNFVKLLMHSLLCIHFLF